jgi:hypothetical protein
MGYGAQYQVLKQYLNGVVKNSEKIKILENSNASIAFLLFINLFVWIN